MMTLEQIIEIIKRNDKPYIVLRRIVGFNKFNAGNYNCENVSKDANIEEKKASAIEWLIAYLEIYKEHTVFIIDLKTSSTANGSGVITFQFEINGSSGTNKSNEQTNVSNNFSAEHLRGLGYIPESELRAREAELKAEFERKIFEQKIVDLEKKFNEQLGTVKSETTSNIVKSISDNIVEAVKVFKGISKEDSELAGTEKKETQKPDIRKIEIDKLAQLMYDKGVSIPFIKKVEQIVTKPKPNTEDKPKEEIQTETQNEQTNE